MSGGPFRELFVELSETAFAIAKGIGEQAVREAQKPSPALPQYKPGPLSLLRDALEGESFARAFAERFGWRRVVSMARNPMLMCVDFVIQHRCGHLQRLAISELAAVVSPRPMVGIGDALRSAQDREPRACYCTPRSE